MRRNLHTAPLGLLAVVTLLAACESQSGIQSRYISKQSDCRDQAEDRIDSTPGVSAMTAKQRNATLVDYFSTCMIKSGWHVARPVKNPVVPTPPGTVRRPEEAALPAQPLPGQPSNVITSASPVQSSPPNQPVKTESSVLQPSPGQPVLNPPANSQLPTGGTSGPSQTSPGPASYQRAPLSDESGLPLPGRQF